MSDLAFAKKPKKSERQHRIVYRALLDRVVKGAYPQGSKMPTQEQLCRDFSVSRATVLHALDDLKKEGWIHVIQGAGCYVNSKADSSLQLGLIIPGMAHHESDSVFFAVQHRINEEAQKLGWHLLPTSSPSEQAAADSQPVELARRLIRQGLRAAIFLPHTDGGRANSFNRNVLAEFDAAQVAVTLVDCDIIDYPHRSSYDLVCLDHQHAGQMVGDHLVAAGCRRVVFVSPCNKASSIRARLEGARHAFARAQAASSLRTFLELDPNDLRQLKKFLQAERPDGIICSSDWVAARMQRNLLSLGVKIPDEIKMASFDDSPVASQLPVPLTTAAQPVEALAYRVVETLRDRLDRRDLPPVTVQVQSHLVVRESTRTSRS